MGSKKTQFVYIVAEENATDYLKIGSATDLNTRVVGLACGNHRNLVLLDYIQFNYEWIDNKPLQVDNEKAIHKQFAHLRYKREWFSYSEEIIEYFKAKNSRSHNWTGICYRDLLPGNYPTLEGIIVPHNNPSKLFNEDRTKLKNVKIKPPEKPFSFTKNS